jgi:hypothetical protein
MRQKVTTVVTPVMLSQLLSEIVDLDRAEIPGSCDGREIGADINGTKLWSGRKEKWLGVWTSRSGRGILFY